MFEQDYEAEFAGLPGKYAPPQGRLLLAWRDRSVVGCAALRLVDPVTYEMKRVYVRPAARGVGLGRRPVAGILEEQFVLLLNPYWVIKVS